MKLNDQNIAFNAVLEAYHLCATISGNLKGLELSKDDKSPVTIADFGAQALIGHALSQERPEDVIVGEEDSVMLREPGNASLLGKLGEAVRSIKPTLSNAEILDAIDRGCDPGGASGRRWTLDPVDGTKGFLRGDQYAIALALLDAGTPISGLLGCPNLPSSIQDTKGCIFLAVQGEGSWELRPDKPIENGVPIYVTKNRTLSECRFCESVESGHSSHDVSAMVASTLGVTEPPHRIDSQCKYAAVARGEAEIYLRLPTIPGYEEKIWDHAAGALCVEAAGGTVTDIFGKALDFSLGRTLKANKGVVATNGPYHDEVIAAIARHASNLPL